MVVAENIRIYDTGCDMPSQVLAAIKSGNFDLKVWLGLPLIENQDFAGPLNDILRAITTCGLDHINGLSIGNEFLLSDAARRSSQEKVKMIAARVKAVKAELPPEAAKLSIGYVDIAPYFQEAPGAVDGLVSHDFRY